MSLLELVRRAAATRLLVTDVDGVLTDGGVYYSARGEELKRFSIRDGMGVERLRDAGVETAIITGERSESVARRAEKLGITRLVLGARDKRRALAELIETTGLATVELAYIGDDVNDLPALEIVARAGLTSAPADAMPEVRAVAHHPCAARGGHGAFRDFAEWILRLKGGLP